MDKIQVLKRESAAGGGKDEDDVPYPAPLEPMEDAVEARGYYIQNDTTIDTAVVISRDGPGNMTFKDNVVTSEKTLGQLLTADGHTALTNNPHQTDAAQVGAAPLAHAHSAADLTSGTVPDARMSGIYSGIGLKLTDDQVIYSRPNTSSPSTAARTGFRLAELYGNSSTSTGAIVFRAPVGAFSYIFHNVEISGMLYTDGPVKVLLQGYRNLNSVVSTHKISLGKVDPPIRWGIDSNSRLCIVMGYEDSVWSFPHITLSLMLASYSSISDSYMEGWTADLSSDISDITYLTDEIASDLGETAGKYIQSRGMNLITNGSALMGTNYNFTAWSLDKTELVAGGGSFKTDVYTTSRFNDEFLPVDPGKTYEFRFWIKSKPYVGNRFYAGGSFYDVDGLAISPTHTMRIAGTDTVLAAPLKPGDTVVHLVDASNWYNETVTTHQRFVIWKYKNSYGYEYPPYTYSRYTSGTVWSAGAVDYVLNTVTLDAPLASAMGNPDDPQGEWPAGTPLSNGSSGGSYKYFVAANQITPEEWTEYRGSVGGLDLSGTNKTNMFPPGSASMKLLFLLNRNETGGCTYVSSLWFSELNPRNLVGLDGAARFTGAIQIAEPEGIVKPTASSTNIGLIWYTPGAPGTADKAEICVKNANGTFSWKEYSYTDHNHDAAYTAAAHAGLTNNPHSVTASQVGAEPAFTKNTAFNKNFGTFSNSVCQGNDVRLSNARTPTYHNHSSLVHVFQCVLNTVSDGDAVCFDPAGYFTVQRADKDKTLGKTGVIGIAQIVSGTDVTVIFSGPAGATVPIGAGAYPLYLGSAGALVTTPPTGANDAVIRVGWAYSDDGADMLVDIAEIPEEGIVVDNATTPQAIGTATATAGNSPDASPRNHVHALAYSATAPPTIGAASAAGSSANPARRDHTHGHGSHSVGTAHSVVSGMTNGFMSTSMYADWQNLLDYRTHQEGREQYTSGNITYAWNTLTTVNFSESRVGGNPSKLPEGVLVSWDTTDQALQVKALTGPPMWVFLRYSIPGLGIFAEFGDECRVRSRIMHHNGTTAVQIPGSMSFLHPYESKMVPTGTLSGQALIDLTGITSDAKFYVQLQITHQYVNATNAQFQISADEPASFSVHLIAYV